MRIWSFFIVRAKNKPPAKPVIVIMSKKALILILKRKNNFVILHFIEVNKYGSIVGRKYRICNRNFYRRIIS